MTEEFLWWEKYRPTRVSETILPDEIKNQFQNFVKEGNIPNLLLHGPAGCGKTTAALAMVKELGAEYIFVNGSLNGNIDTLRSDIVTFASTSSFDGKRKYIIFDEADNLNINSTQPALRGVIEEFSHCCGFILTCNFPNKLMAAIHSRMIDINFRFPKEQQPKLAGQLYKRLVYILKAENVPFEDEALVKLVKKFMPTQDLRKIVNRLQDAATKSDHVDMKTLFAYELAIKQLVDFMKEKNFTNVRKWISDNELAVNDEFFRTLYDEAVTYFVPASVPQVILILAKYQYQQAFVVDIDINMAAMCVEIMIEAQFK